MEDWLRSSTSGLVDKWTILIEVFACVSEQVRTEPLREPPRVGYDPVTDRIFFFFKLEHAGITVVVSERGLKFSDAALLPDGGGDL
ncbi:MAG: hypothetical protein KBG48_36335 [Kofleriaceae bacterium]|nr:hypothetical protein [Kofleriaceae bacterium]MBP9172885.1 hypothetical protein [Kofleriaceae bacterium]